jgi:two-component system, OmpR family, response regulator
MDKRKTLLIVDNNKELREQVTHFFSSKGHQVIQTDNGKEALSLSIKENIDTLILRGQLPDLSGYDLAPIIKKINPDIHIILLLNEEFNINGIESNKTDFFDCLDEPLDLDKINQKVKGHQERRER